MFKKTGVVVLVFFAAIAIMVSSCQDPLTFEPNGSLVPGPGRPGGSGGGSGGGLPAFSINSLPSVASWNKMGEIYEYPNLFQRANGTIISQVGDWETYSNGEPFPANGAIPNGATVVDGGRRAEVKKIVEYYYQGSLPPQPDRVEIISDPGPRPGSLTVRIFANGKSTDFTFTGFTVPALAPNGQSPSATNKVPIVFDVGGTFSSAIGNANGYATISMVPNSDAFTGPVHELFGYAENAPDRPSALVREAWKVARIIDAIELGAFGGIIDPTKTLTSGMSRWGKDALLIGAFAESMKGTRIAVTNPVSSGSGGAAPERWTSFKTTTGSTYSTVYNRDRQGYNDYWLRFITPDTPDGTELSVKVRRQEFDEVFDKTHENYGLQTLAQARAEEYHWFGYRIHEFTEYHKDWRINNRHSTDPNSNDGILESMPLDIHFVIALCAPNAVLFHDGWHSANGRTHPEGQYMMYLADRELYDFLGKPNNIGIRMYDIDHAQPARESYDLVDFANHFFNANHGTNYSRQSSGGYPVPTIEEFTDRITDDEGTLRNVCTWYNPTLREDYLRLNWKNPNRTSLFHGEVGPEARSIADNVRAYFEAHPDELRAPDGSAVMIDYPKSLVPEGY